MTITQLYEPTKADKIDKLRNEVEWHLDELTRLDRELVNIRKRCDAAETAYQNKVDELGTLENEF